TEAPTKDPRTGKVAAATLESGPGAAAEAGEEIGPEPPAEGAGDGAPAAMTALIEAAATMMAVETFFMSVNGDPPMIVIICFVIAGLKNNDGGEDHL
ncbi:hypothetical protein Godav_028650, partial [Gossypium davidsonii]|nr:hypothetical protein [Gossypium davidsonii]